MLTTTTTTTTIQGEFLLSLAQGFNVEDAGCEPKTAVSAVLYSTVLLIQNTAELGSAVSLRLLSQNAKIKINHLQNL